MIQVFSFLRAFSVELLILSHHVLVQTRFSSCGKGMNPHFVRHVLHFYTTVLYSCLFFWSALRSAELDAQDKTHAQSLGTTVLAQVSLNADGRKTHLMPSITRWKSLGFRSQATTSDSHFFLLKNSAFHEKLSFRHVPGSASPLDWILFRVPMTSRLKRALPLVVHAHGLLHREFIG